MRRDALDPRIGQRVLGRYVVTARLGEGAMGSVYRAEQRARHLRRQVAIKILHPEMSHERALRARFLRECELVAGLSHANIVQVFDMGELEDGCLALVMELIEGETLRARLERGPLSVSDAMTVGRGLLSALAAAHDRGVVHRDVKPDNIMLFAHADGGLGVKLLDFGVAQSPDAADALTGHGQLVGTPPYMSPEQLMGRRLDARSDLYAVGITLHEMLSGRHPLGESSSVLGWVTLQLDREPAPLDVPGVPLRVSAVVRRALAKAKENRPQDATEMADALREGALRDEAQRPAPVLEHRPDRSHDAPTFALHAHPHPIVDLDPPRVPRVRGGWTSLLLAAAVLIAFATAFAGLVEHAPVAQNDTPSALAPTPEPVEAL
ncbi:MAG: serine/threonine-protein kinase [Sandaracinaceae bacterium]